MSGHQLGAGIVLTGQGALRAEGTGDAQDIGVSPQAGSSREQKVMFTVP